MRTPILIATAMTVFFTLGCKDNKKHDVETPADIKIEDGVVHQEEFAIDNSWTDEISLNDNQKWTANSETTEGVENMLDLLESTPTESVADYHLLAEKLNDEKNYVVKECTMEGPSHDNLHVFLHPLIDKVEALSNVTNVGEGAIVKESIEENLRQYYNYFK